MIVKYSEPFSQLSDSAMKSPVVVVVVEIVVVVVAVAVVVVVRDERPRIFIHSFIHSFIHAAASFFVFFSSDVILCG